MRLSSVLCESVASGEIIFSKIASPRVRADRFEPPEGLRVRDQVLEDDMPMAGGGLPTGMTLVWTRRMSWG